MSMHQPDRGNPWQPSFNARATLKQLGVNELQIKKLVIEYCAISESPNDKEYQYFVMEQAKVKFPSLSLRWTPSKDIITRLQEKGYSRKVIEYYIDLFIIKNRERGAVIVEANAAFLSYIYSACPSERIEALSKAAWMSLVLMGISSSEISCLIKIITDLTTIPASEIPETSLVDLIVNLRD
jgi:hypothetical protein